MHTNLNVRNSFFYSIPPVTRNLLLINILVWLACAVSGGRLVYFLGLFSIDGGHFSPYQLVTYMFTHQAFSHLFFNMFALFMFGRSMESYWGPKRFLTYYLVTGIGAGLIQLLVCHLQGIDSLTIGASGSVFGILLAFGMTFPNAPLFLMFIPVPIKAKYMVLGYGLLELYYGVANQSGDDVAHFAHLGGMLFGIILILYWRNDNLSGRFNRWWRQRKNPKNGYRRSETDYGYNQREKEKEKKIDSILDKIKKSGYNSLSESEKKTLFDAKK
ncbi:MAG: rhomboid family intramembrane serine protease [Candidatus Symbiothrix sp.]|jgi:membrane associated rhomboid family serine protease|nr:rhomboid family intramembrane serine protease [Candidatus Symbiothrix sp.]